MSWCCPAGEEPYEPAALRAADRALGRGRTYFVHSKVLRFCIRLTPQNIWSSDQIIVS